MELCRGEAMEDKVSTNMSSCKSICVLGIVSGMYVCCVMLSVICTM